jgi:hypothetical protein
LRINSDRAKNRNQDRNQDRNNDRAEAAFKKKEERLREGEQAMAQCEADRRAVLEKTARLRALRLARDAAVTQAATPAAEAKRSA